MFQDSEKRGDIYRATAETELDKRLKAFWERLEGGPRDRAEPQARETTEYDDKTGSERYGDLRSRAISVDDKTCGKPTARNIHVGHRARLRRSALRDMELAGFGEIDQLELLLSFVVPQRDVNPTAHALLDKFGSVAATLDASPESLAEVSGVTADAAVMLSVAGRMSMWRRWRGLRLACPADTADFFGSMFIGGAGLGTYVAYLDSRFSIVSVERYDKSGVPVREIIGSAVKYGARNVIAVRRADGLFPDALGLTRAVSRLAAALEATGARLVDHIMFTDYGYYMLGELPESSGEWYPQYVFVPEKLYSRSARAAELARRCVERENDEK